MNNFKTMHVLYVLELCFCQIRSDVTRDHFLKVRLSHYQEFEENSCLSVNVTIDFFFKSDYGIIKRTLVLFCFVY